MPRFLPIFLGRRILSSFSYNRMISVKLQLKAKFFWLGQLLVFLLKKGMLRLLPTKGHAMPPLLACKRARYTLASYQPFAVGVQKSNSLFDRQGQKSANFDKRFADFLPFTSFQRYVILDKRKR